LLLFFGVPFFLLLVVVGLIRARKEEGKEKRTDYLMAAGGIALALSFVCMALNQFLPFLFFFSITVLLFLVAGPMTVMEITYERAFVKPLESIDLSAPLRVRDIFTTNKGWLVIVLRWGILRASLLRCLFDGAIIGGVNAILGLLGIMSTTEAGTYTIIAIIASAVYHYWNFSKLF
jgi:hypothetical protein